jgi:hypothetical protein
MSVPLRVKRGDTPTLTGTVSDDSGPVDISAASSVSVGLRSMRTSQVEPIVKPGTILDTGTADRGRWSYKCDADDLAVAGTYGVTVSVAWADGNRYTFPTQGAVELVVEDW